MLTETPPIGGVARRFNKHVLNPAMMHLAGRRYWYAAVMRHTGRRSGRHYATPVVADRVANGFIVPLPYGTDVDWLRNVQESGAAAVSIGGHTYDVVEPEIIDAATAGPQLSPSRRRVFQVFGIKRFVKLKMDRS
ncbi:nitroreductase/quinone reductase family protein [Mycolicibacterium gadium]|uniref:Nitroreductase/quinone reductase family protein n=1 Tax=Mycolicibacterium gadium TaxID=1794 RepID=A0ABT6GJZ6_MYCGU|nr:nitroreductase/quinone reductase family protein [Mycolicibacterium gadium]MDG5481605.1 nitroreductase/quinone reductase family protein [Mycolicibacterium gadium]